MDPVNDPKKTLAVAAAAAVFPPAGALAMASKGVETIGKVAMGEMDPAAGLTSLALPPKQAFKTHP